MRPMNVFKPITGLGKNSLLFISGQTISRIGDMAQLVGLSMYVYKASNNIFAVSLLYAVEALSMIIFGQIGGLLADKWERKSSLITLQVCQALLIGMIPFAGHGAALYALFFIFTACTSVSHIFQSAISGDVAEPARYEKFQALYSSLQSFSTIIGPVIGAWIFSVFGTTSLFVFNALSFLICAATISLIDLPPPAAAPADASGERKKPGYLAQWKDGYRVALGKPDLAAVIFSMPIIMLGVGILNTIFIGISTSFWMFSDKQFGWLMAASGIGGLLGGLAYGAVHSRCSAKTLFYSALAVKALCLLISAYTKSFFLVFALFIVNSVGFSNIVSTARIFFIKNTDPLERGRVSGISGSLASISMLCGSSAAGFFVAYGGYRFSIGVIIAFHILCALSFWLIGHKRILQRGLILEKETA
ncbi:MAG: MFS transporter [Elusimicrobiales bacterium]|nr:MFS transporter [Elusimicrobiales bacterium]